jgi:hypothetical protein
MFLEIDHQLNQQNLEQNLQLPECSEDLPKQSEIETTLSNARHKFGLKPLEVQVGSIGNLFDETNIIQGALEIKLESDVGDYEVTEHYSDVQDFSDSSSEDDEEEEEEEEEDDSEIEELSDSQLRKHEDSLQLKDESSDSGQEDRKSRKRKCRKSSEEKLFE